MGCIFLWATDETGIFRVKNGEVKHNYDTAGRVSHFKIENDAMYYLLGTTPKRYNIKNGIWQI